MLNFNDMWRRHYSLQEALRERQRFAGADAKDMAKQKLFSQWALHCRSVTTRKKPPTLPNSCFAFALIFCLYSKRLFWLLKGRGFGKFVDHSTWQRLVQRRVAAFCPAAANEPARISLHCQLFELVARDLRVQTPRRKD